MAEQLEAFQSLSAEVVVVSFVKTARLKQYLSMKPWPFRVFADPDRAAYHAFGLESATSWQMLRPSVIWKYLKLIARGRMPKSAQEDVHQLGGDFVLDAEGRIVFAYRSADPADRPSVAMLLDAVVRAVA